MEIIAGGMLVLFIFLLSLSSDMIFIRYFCFGDNRVAIGVSLSISVFHAAIFFLMITSIKIPDYPDIPRWAMLGGIMIFLKFLILYSFANLSNSSRHKRMSVGGQVIRFAAALASAPVSCSFLFISIWALGTSS